MAVNELELLRPVSRSFYLSIRLLPRALRQPVALAYLLARTSDTAFSAIEAVCTHEGCTVSGADGAVYVCPCHGSRYDRSGHVIEGPAKASLRQYANTFTDGVVTIAL